MTLTLELLEEIETLKADNARLREALGLFLDNAEPPPKEACSCHISPPCNDCVDYSGLREAFIAGREAWARTEPTPKP